MNANIKKIMVVITWLFVTLYPLIMYFGLSHGFVGIIFFFVAFYFINAMVNAARAKLFIKSGLFSLIFLIIILGIWLSVTMTTRLIPVVINLMLMLIFARTLWQGPPLIELFARLDYEVIPPDLIKHCHCLTIVWAMYFLVIAVIALFFACFASNEAWAVFNGLIVYLLIGFLVVGEYIYRRIRYRDHDIASFIDTIKSIAKNSNRLMHRRQ